MNPHRRNPWRWLNDRRLTTALKVVALIVLVCYALQFVVGFLAQVRAVVYIVIGSIFFAYLIHPAVRRLRRRMPLGLAIVIVYAGILIAIGAFGWFVIPRLSDDVGAIGQHYP